MITTLQETRNLFSEESLNEIMGEPVGRADEIARSALLKGGHRWRPFLFVGVSRVLLGGSTGYEKSLAVAIECMHKASMIHDDIEDDDKPDALHRTVGVAQALNAGDLLIHESYRLMLDAGFRFRTSIPNRCQKTMCFGQGQELDHRGDFAAQKTSPLFEAAFLMALADWGDGFRYEPAAINFCKWLGIAYQAKDDYEDGEGQPYWASKFVDAITASRQFDNPELVKFLDEYLALVFGTQYPSLPTSQERSSVPAP